MLPAAHHTTRWIADLGLPPLPREELERCSELSQQIRQQITAAGGQISFCHYMEQALYAPTLGYYTGGKQKLGNSGDFITAPELSPLFGRCLARPCAEALTASGGDTILEFGAGSGRLAVDLLRELEQLDQPPKNYWILDISPDLRQLQRQTIARELPAWQSRIRWLDHLPAKLNGVILANEVVDAMPVHRFRIHHGSSQEAFIGWESRPDGGAFTLHWQPSALTPEIEALGLELADGYSSERNLLADAWIHELATHLQRGLILLIDYGYTRSEYYHPERSSGTLLCHFRHHAHPDPLLLPGLQDITAHVDFTALANSAHAAGLEVAGYTTQGNFLLNCGLDQLLHPLLQGSSDTLLEPIQQVKRLTLPTQMGERFKVLALSRGLAHPPSGFQRHDQRHRL